MSVRRLAKEQPASFAFSSETLKAAKWWIAKYPEGRQQSAVIPILWRAQEQAGGWTPQKAIEHVADLLGMAYIRVLEIFGLATVKKLAPQPRFAQPKPAADLDTLHAIIANRYDVLSRYAKSVRLTYPEEMQRLKRWSPRDAEVLRPLKRALLRGQAAAGAESARLAEALKNSRALATVIAMRHELAALWERSHASKEQLLRQLQDWCRRAEASGVAPLVDFSARLRSYA